MIKLALVGVVAAAMPFLVMWLWGLKIKWMQSPPASQRAWPSSMLLSNVSGFPSPPFVTDARVASLENGSFVHRADDVWVVAYPKSGTTMMQVTVAALLGHTVNGIACRHQRHFCPWPERGVGGARVGVEELNSRASPRCLKSHWPAFGHMDVSVRQGRVVFILRNVVDVAVSYFHHVRDGHLVFRFEGGWDEFFEMFVSGDVASGNYFEYVASWWPQRENPRVLWLRYEEMMANRSEGVRKVARFLDSDAGQGELADVLHTSSFANMRSLEDTWGNWFFRTFGGRHNMRTRDRNLGTKVRPSASQIDALEKQYERVLRPLGVAREMILPE